MNVVKMEEIESLVKEILNKMSKEEIAHLYLNEKLRDALIDAIFESIPEGYKLPKYWAVKLVNVCLAEIDEYTKEFREALLEHGCLEVYFKGTKGVITSPYLQENKEYLVLERALEISLIEYKEFEARCISGELELAES